MISNASALEKSFILCESGDTPLPKKAPKNAVLGSSLNHIKTLSNSSHSVSKMTLADQIVYFKQCDGNYPPLLAQIEAAASASLRLARGEYAARVRPVVDLDGTTIGTISYAHIPFKPINEVELTQETVVTSGFVDELVARYIREEDDFNPNNVGMTLGDKIAGIDDDMMFYPITSELKGPRLINNGYISPTPDKAFAKTPYDLENFPMLRDCFPCFWPTKFPANGNFYKDFKQRSFFMTLRNNKPFCDMKWRCFIKEMLIPMDEHLEAIRDNFEESDEARQELFKLSHHIVKIYNDLEEKLVQTHSFRRFIKENSDLEVPHSLIKKCLVKDLTLTLFRIGLDLNFKDPTLFQLMVQLLQEFEKNSTSLESDVTKLIHSLPSSNEAQQILETISHYQSFWNQMPVDTHSMTTRLIQHVQLQPEAITEPERLIADEIKRWIKSQDTPVKLIECIVEAQNEYTPTLQAINPMSLFRTRGKAFDSLISELQKGQGYEAIKKFFASGGWNTPGYLTHASANVILIRKLCDAALEEFHQMLSPHLLKNHNLVKVCFLIQNGKWSIDQHAEEIAKYLYHNHLNT